MNFNRDVAPVYSREADHELAEFVDDDYPDEVDEIEYNRGLITTCLRKLYSVDTDGTILVDWDSVRRALREGSL